MQKTRLMPVVENKAPKPTKQFIVVRPTVHLHPTVTQHHCGKCAFLDRNAKLCELTDDEVFLDVTKKNFVRSAACTSAEVFGAAAS